MNFNRDNRKLLGFIPKSLALIVFVIMVSSQVVGYAGPGTTVGLMFPSAAFGGGKLAVSPTNTIQQNAPQSPGAPLPPGTVSYQNTWNNSQALACPVSTVVSQALLPTVGNAWTLNTSIPTLLFMNKPSGRLVNQTYQAFSNGTVTVSDSSGNSFGWTLTEGLTGATRAPLLSPIVRKRSKTFLCFRPRINR